MKKVIGVDLGDKKNVAVIYDADGTEHKAVKINCTREAMKNFFSKHAGAVVVMEAGTHSGWSSRLLEGMGHDVWVGNPRRLRAIWDASDKSDERDARVLGLMYRLEPRLLHRIFHRGEQAQCDLAMIKSRQMLVETRTKLVNHVRCVVKGMGERIGSCSAASFHKRAMLEMPACLMDALTPVVDQIEKLSETIKGLDQQIDHLAQDRYPETNHLIQVGGVGTLTALAFVLTIEDAGRFDKSRDVGPYLGLTPRKDQSGQTDKQLPITKQGNTYMRSLLVGCSHYIMGPFGPDCDLRRHGMRIASGGGKNAKRRAVVAVARKLAVLLHQLWTSQGVYEPLRQKLCKAA
ncbi:MAG: IS110 family transposase [Kiritimatiellia bacterium]|nr:IS110 family transposase [Kiritimatiellia bacterium]